MDTEKMVRVMERYGRVEFDPMTKRVVLLPDPRFARAEEGHRRAGSVSRTGQRNGGSRSCIGLRPGRSVSATPNPCRAAICWGWRSNTAANASAASGFALGIEKEPATIAFHFDPLTRAQGKIAGCGERPLGFALLTSHGKSVAKVDPSLKVPRIEFQPATACCDRLSRVPRSSPAAAMAALRLDCRAG